MSEKSKQSKPEEQLVVREQVALESKEIPFEDLVCRPEEYSFRDGDDLSQKSLQSLADDIAANGLISPLLVQEENGKYLVLNGNRRYGAMSLLVEKQIAGCGQQSAMGLVQHRTRRGHVWRRAFVHHP